jgi:hypothetical protein
MSIKAKVLSGTVAVLFLGTLLLLWQLSRNYDENLQTIGKETLAAARSSFHQLEENDVRMLAAVGDAIKANTALSAAYKAHDRSKLAALTTPLYAGLKKEYGITHWNYIDGPPSSVIFLRMSKTELFGDTVKRITYLDAVKTGKLSSGKEIGKTGFVLRTVSPVEFAGTILGYLELGEDIDRFFGLIKKQTGSDVALVVAKKHINPKEWESTCAAKKMRNNWNDFPDHLIVSNTSTDTGFVPPQFDFAGLGEKGVVLGEKSSGEKVFQRGAFPVSDASKATIGCILVVQDITAVKTRLAQTQLFMIIAIVVQAIVLCALILYLLYTLVFKRLTAMTERVTRVVGGDQTISVKETDEIGVFESQIIEILKSITAGMS